MKKMIDFTHLSSSDISYVDGLYAEFKENPENVDESWRRFFQGFEFNHPEILESREMGGQISEQVLRKEFNVFRLIQSFRSRGHLLSDTNPIRPRKDRDARISLSHYDLSDEDLEKTFLCGEFVGLGPAKLGDILRHLKSIYCGKIGVEYMHITDTDQRRWFRDRFESTASKINYPIEKKKQILRKLNEATVFEQFLQTKFIGQKRFSLEGGESTIPALDSIVQHGIELGAKEFVIGMAHRGRLNVLANILNKTYEFIFKEFEGGRSAAVSPDGDGDVKYHLGFTSIRKTEKGEANLKILPNPSHLEAVAPVVLGYCRSLRDVVYQGDYNQVIPIVIHGDAAVAGQGVVYECVQMSKLEAYKTGGTIHFVINNQIGFTTDFGDARSSIYSTSIAKTVDAPVIHVNGDCPEEVVYACELAVDFRQKFNCDVFVDMVCYRKHGHNEGDEPKYTQPHLYGLVAKHKNPRELYIDKLMESNKDIKDLAKQMQKEFKDLLAARLNNAKQNEIPTRTKGPLKEWKDLDWSKPKDFDQSPDTSVKKEKLKKIIETISSTPEGFKTLKKAQKILDERKERFESDRIDWATAELLSFGALLLDGNHVRFSGQDVIRGTFSHRHAKVFDEFTNEAYCALDNIEPDKQGKMRIYNSHLSEYAVLGFEYGYSQGTPRSLIIWEAQFGDFSNGAQIMIDQFISAAESKWRRMSGLVMLLPHGYEGQGPEHSSARLERYLQMCAEYNMVVANCTTPANYFHILRRQQTWNFRKPLIVFTPKSLLRDSRCISSVEDLSKGRFQEVIDQDHLTATKVKRVLFCSGKIYYDLLEYQEENKRQDVAIVRVEQLYPLPEKQIEKILKRYKNAKEKIWVQEEPLNMGGWMHLLRWREFFQDFTPIARKSSASPATGYSKVHDKEQKDIVEKAFK